MSDGTRAAAAALVLLIGSGAMLVAGSLVMHAGRVMELSGLVGGGLSGIAVLLVGVLCAPNAAIAGAGYLTGPGFAVGTDTVVSPFSTSHGTLPAVPVLGAVPSGHGAGPVVLAWLVLTLVGTGAAVAAMLWRRPATGRMPSVSERLQALGVAAAGAGLGLAVLAWFAGGSLGTDRLATVGASPWQVGLAFAGEIAVVGLALLGGGWLLRWMRSITGRSDATLPTRERALAAVGARDTSDD